ncbi:MAG: hypothetical protein VKM34_05205 [Cyanobacteriota bacterium]|nr:hypothetical protein [Cyanobacteriota bacterium]
MPSGLAIHSLEHLHDQQPAGARARAVWIQDPEVFRQATAEGHPAIRLNAHRPIRQGNLLYTNSSW